MPTPENTHCFLRQRHQGGLIVLPHRDLKNSFPKPHHSMQKKEE